MSLIFKITVYPVLYLISLLPFFILNFISFNLYSLVYYVLGYRKQVVLENLKKSFPNKSIKEINQISKNFYKHFCDLVIENIKLISISNEKFMKYCYFTPNALQLFNHYHNQNKTIILALGHNGNWEWSLIAHQLNYKHNIVGIYHPLSNKNMDSLISKLRNRGSVNLVTMQNSLRFLIGYKPQTKPGSIGLIADQTPPKESSFWFTFLNQDTPFFGGPEKMAKKFDIPILFVAMRKVKRNTYELDAKLITEKPNETIEGEITQNYANYLQELIIEQPEYWLWSHKRWKHKRTTNN